MTLEELHISAVLHHPADDFHVAREGGTKQSVPGAILMSKAVGNDHFCDTTKRTSPRLTPI